MVRRLLLALTLLFAAGTPTDAITPAQQIILFGNAVNLSSCPSQALTYFASLATQPTTARKLLYCSLVSSLLSGNVWSSLDVLEIYAAADSATALTPLIGPAPAAVNSPAFTANQGFAGNGTSSYINTNFAPATGTHNFSLSSETIAIWDLTSRSANSGIEIGTYNGSTLAEIATNNGGSTYFPLSGGPLSITAISSNGFFVASYLSPTLNFWISGVNQDSAAYTPSSLSSYPIYVGARNTAGAADSFSTDVIGVVAIGGGLTTAQANALYSAVHTYMQAVAGVP